MLVECFFGNLINTNDFFQSWSSQQTNRNFTFCMFRIGYFWVWDSDLWYLSIVSFRAPPFLLPLFNLEEIHFDKHFLSEWYSAFSIYTLHLWIYIYIHIISYARSIYICNGYIIMVCCWTYPPWMQGATSKNLHPSRRNQDSIEPKPGVLLDHVYAGKALHHFCVPWPFGPLPWGDSQKFQRLKWVVWEVKGLEDGYLKDWIK